MPDAISDFAVPLPTNAPQSYDMGIWLRQRAAGFCRLNLGPNLLSPDEAAEAAFIPLLKGLGTAHNTPRQLPICISLQYPSVMLDKDTSLVLQKLCTSITLTSAVFSMHANL